MTEGLTMNTDLIGGRKPLPVPLDQEDEKLLREVVASSFWSPSQHRRARAVLGVARGGRLCQLTSEIGYSESSIRRACRRFRSEGLAGLLTERQRPGRPRRQVRVDASDWQCE